MVLVGLPVVVAAVVLYASRKFAVPDVLRTLVQEVLEQMREAGLSRFLVSRAHVVGDAQRYDRCSMIRGNDDAEAVWQFRLRELDFRNGDGPDCDGERQAKHNGKKNFR